MSLLRTEACRDFYHMRTFTRPRSLAAPDQPGAQEAPNVHQQAIIHTTEPRLWIKNQKALYEQMGNRLQAKLLNKASKLQNSMSMYTVSVKAAGVGALASPAEEAGPRM